MDAVKCSYIVYALKCFRAPLWCPDINGRACTEVIQEVPRSPEAQRSLSIALFFYAGAKYLSFNRVKNIEFILSNCVKWSLSQLSDLRLKQPVSTFFSSLALSGDVFDRYHLQFSGKSGTCFGIRSKTLSADGLRNWKTRTCWPPLNSRKKWTQALGQARFGY